MFVKIALIVIVFLPDGSGYKDFVALFDTPAQCEKAKVELLKAVPGELLYVGSCSKPRPVKSVDI